MLIKITKNFNFYRKSFHFSFYLIIARQSSEFHNYTNYSYKNNKILIMNRIVYMPNTNMY